MMDNEITIKDGKEFSAGREVVAAAYKKIKVSSEKRANIEEMRNKLLSVVESNVADLDKIDTFKESPVVETSEEPIVEDDTKVEFPEFEEKEIVNEEVELPKEPMEFAFRTSDKAYHAIEAEDEISEAQEEQIRGLGSAYKGTNPNSELRKVMEEAPKEKEDDGINIWLIILPILGFLVLAIIVFLIIKYIRLKNKKNSLEEDIKTIEYSNEVQKNMLLKEKNLAKKDKDYETTFI